jgi:hypothetical protein
VNYSLIILCGVAAVIAVIVLRRAFRLQREGGLNEAPGSRTKNLAQESDFGRRFCWFIERGGKQIGSLEYLRWNSDSQFWHEYQLNWRSAEGAVGPDAWIDEKLVLRNQRYTDVVLDGFLTTDERAPGVIAVRFASVPLERFERDVVL